MGRTLPWTINSAKPSSSKSATSSSSRPPKRQKVNSLEPASPAIGTSIKREQQPKVEIKDEAGFSSPTAPRDPRIDNDTKILKHDPPYDRRDRRRDGRSLSSSPPLPASKEQDTAFMHEGADFDDAYMLVEDEFQAVAQSYTMHLHRAEYKRLMNEAKERNRNRQTEDIVLPANAALGVKQKFARDRLERRQKEGLRGVVGDGEADAEDEGEVEKDLTEPWAGTTLAGLMNWDGSKKTSLRGLERIPSDSKAARGVRDAEELTREDRSDKIIDYGSVSSRKLIRGDSTVKVTSRNDEATADESGRSRPGQDIPAGSRNNKRYENTNEATGTRSVTMLDGEVHLENGSVVGKPQSMTATYTASGRVGGRQTRASKSIFKPKEFDDSFDEAAIVRPDDDANSRLDNVTISRVLSPMKYPARRDFRKKAAEVKEDLDSRADEIPLFL